MRFMWKPGAFKENIYKKGLLSKKENNNNSKELLISNCARLKREREELIKELNELGNKACNKALLKIIEYFYYSKRLSN